MATPTYVETLEDVARLANVTRQAVHGHAKLGAPLVKTANGYEVAPYLTWKQQWDANRLISNRTKTRTTLPESTMAQPSRAVATQERDELGLPPPITMGDFLRREQTLIARVQKQLAVLELKKVKGELVPREEARAAAEGVRDAIVREVDSLCAGMLALLPQFKASERDAIIAAFQQAWSASRTRLSKRRAHE